MHPIDTIKTVQQAAPAVSVWSMDIYATTCPFAFACLPIHYHNPQGMSVINACRKILHDMGPIGFYAGVVPYVTMDGLSGAIKVRTDHLDKQGVQP